MAQPAPGEDAAPRFLFRDAADLETPVGRAINGDFLADEERVVRALARAARFTEAESAEVQLTAQRLVEAVRAAPAGKSGLDAFLRQYDLSSQEGVILMCLAEALLRIPDDETADRLIADKLRAGDWASHLGDSQSLFVNASTWGLMLTGRIVRLDPGDVAAPAGAMARVVGRMGEPVVRTAMRQAMRIMGHQFVMGRTIVEALDNSLQGDNRRYRYTFDMLGEAALTGADADRYFESYRSAIGALAARAAESPDAGSRPSISVKLSALHPRFERSQRGRVLAELAPRLVELGVTARDAGVALTLDAEESERLELTLELLEAACRDRRLEGWAGLGLAVQAYQKRAPAVLRYLIGLAHDARRTLNVRLVKGAYWDSEVKRAQERGLPGYPVFTRKPGTDVSYLACARLMLEQGAGLYPQFATHNAHTVAAIWHLARQRNREFEFQRLHGMGEELYAAVTRADGLAVPCRVYAPVGEHEDLLPYLVRRLLENGANTSFVNRIVNENEPVEAIVADPVRTVDELTQAAHPRIPLPADIYRPERRNSTGLQLADGAVLAELAGRMQRVSRRPWLAVPVVAGEEQEGPLQPVRNPANTSEVVGTVRTATPSQVEAAVSAAARAQPAWNHAGAEVRAAALSGPPTCSSPACTSSSPCACARPARPFPTALQRYARRWTSCATTQRGLAPISGRHCECRVRPAKATRCRCTVVACSHASVPGTSRSRSSRGRSPRPSPRATPWWRNPPSRRRWSRRRRCGCCCRRVCRPTRCTSCRVTARRSGDGWWRTRGSPAWPSRARRRRLASSIAGLRPATVPSRC
jgi:RHH-type transcriptional regulator, proline utilization regulon repressor / proline dehydrogenase / delta 1-pyrroline-5-carboxylate dehydrogenase